MSEKTVQLNEEVIKGQIKELVRGRVEEVLIEMYLAGASVRRRTRYESSRLLPGWKLGSHAGMRQASS